MEFTKRELSEIVRAMDKEMGKVEHIFPTVMYPQEYEAYKRAEREHAPNVAVRLNGFRVEYYNTITGEVVSSHC